MRFDFLTIPIPWQREFIRLRPYRVYMRLGFTLIAVALMLLMPMAGCLESEPKTPSPVDDEDEDEPVLNLSAELSFLAVDIGWEEPAVFTGLVSGWQDGLNSSLELLGVKRNHEDAEVGGYLLEIEESGAFIILIEFSAPGYWTFIPRITISEETSLYLPPVSVEVGSPTEAAPMITIQTMFEVDSTQPFTLQGSIAHDSLETCTLVVIMDSGAVFNAVDVDDLTGSFDVSMGAIEESVGGAVHATCGIWSSVSTNRSFVLLSSNSDDIDGDGIDDDFDSCPDGWGEDDGWSSSNLTDIDGDGCHDGWEDLDDDDDGISDVTDRCPHSPGWNSTIEVDHDSDGCRDADEDDDDDDDGVLDIADSCPTGATKWTSGFASDWDGDGCRDADEDDDDDADGLNDDSDACPTGAIDWLRDTISDWDDDGCRDSDEDVDDDDDGVNDVNLTGDSLDICPFTDMNRSDVDENGCAGNQRDSDNDGILDDEDECPGTPEGNPVSEVGCSDLDGDGVFSNVDLCPDTPVRWTPDADGCTVNQLPVPWNQGPYGSGRMDIVSSFSFPTLAGTNWNFGNQWTGNDTYLFLFKYTDSNGNSNSGTWAYNPATIIRALPDNVHLFFGSFDSSFHSDVVDRKADVQNKLTASEEAKWMSRIHFIDQEADSLSGGIGGLIQNWGAFYYGIDRFQQSREMGSLHDWSQGGNCCTNPKHLAFEPHTWNSEYSSRIRGTDPGVTSVPMFEDQWHNGGWSGGYSSYANATFPDSTVMAGFDTMEVYAYHACEDNRMRYSGGGCHEWDYLHYLRICDADNSSVCNTEFVRYITTYGREGQWLTDITPYLWMVQDGGDRRFKFLGANKMGVEITVLLSNWGEDEVPFAAEHAFSGGQFKGEYNNQSQHKRQHLFTPPGGTDKVEIVATITGHGFNSDAANCSEFCNHEHHYSMNGYTAMEDHPTVGQLAGCQNLVNQGVTANQFGSWPYGRAGWCAGQDVKQWKYDITPWVNFGVENNLSYRGLYQGQEYVPQSDTGGNRNIEAHIWLVFYNETGAAIGTTMQHNTGSAFGFAEDCGIGGSSEFCHQHLMVPNSLSFSTAALRPFGI